MKKLNGYLKQMISGVDQSYLRYARFFQSLFDIIPICVFLHKRFLLKA